jgi:hypothetical protein
MVTPRKRPPFRFHDTMADVHVAIKQKTDPHRPSTTSNPHPADQIQAQKQQSRLHSLSAHTRPIDTIPDGACPSALPLLLTRLGAYSDDNNTINALIRSTLSITFTLAEVHKTWKVHHFQLIGIPLICDTTLRHLYMIHVNDKLAPSAHQQLLQHVLTREALKRIGQKEHNREDNAIVQKCNEVWNTTLQKRGQQEPTTLHDSLVTLATALYKWGACICYCSQPRHCQISDKRLRIPNIPLHLQTGKTVNN